MPASSDTSPPHFKRHARAALVAAALLTGAVLVGAQRVVGWDAVLHVARGVPALGWVAFAIFMTGSYATRVCRLWTLMRRIGRHTSLRSSASLFLVHNTLVTFLPARLGEAALPILAHRWAALDWRPVLGALAWWRLGDLTVVAALALALVALGASALAPLLVLAGLAFVVPFAAFALRQWLLRDAPAAKDRAGVTPRVRSFLHRVARGMPGTWRALSGDLAFAVTSWILKIAGLSSLAVPALTAQVAGASSSLAWPRIAASVLAGDVTGSLPLPSLGSVGTYEAGLVAGLAASGVAVEQGFAVALLVHGALLASVLLGGLLGAGLRLRRSA